MKRQEIYSILWALSIIIGVIAIIQYDQNHNSTTTQQSYTIIDSINTGQYHIPQTWSQRREQGSRPLLDPQHPFPVYKQFLNGCYAFSIKQIMEYQYAIHLSMQEMELSVDKPRNKLWNKKYTEQFNNRANIHTLRYQNVDTLLSKLEKGIPVLLQYQIPHGTWFIGHNAVAYSFDQDWLWIANPLYGTREHLAIKEIIAAYDSRKLRYPFAIIHTLPESPQNK